MKWPMYAITTYTLREGKWHKGHRYTPLEYLPPAKKKRERWTVIIKHEPKEG